MTLEVREVEWTKPLPGPDRASAEFWAALATGRLLIQSCTECGGRQFYPRPLCVSCGAEPAWEEASGLGTVHTFTVVRQNGAPSFRDETPYVVAMIELEEGPRMMGNVTGCPTEEVRIGMAVQAYSLKVAPDIGVAMWEPAARE
jgi:uncharacterized OB-fold protein